MFHAYYYFNDDIEVAFIKGIGHQRLKPLRMNRRIQGDELVLCATYVNRKLEETLSKMAFDK